MQSVICKPAHGQYIPLARAKEGESPLDAIFTVGCRGSPWRLSHLLTLRGTRRPTARGLRECFFFRNHAGSVDLRVHCQAYHGNGNLVQRVELTLDGGKSWRYCFRRLPEDGLRHGDKYWVSLVLLGML
jgi:hypothetical protein